MTKRPLYGIIGGMGPAASASFINYIYSQCAGKFKTEQDYPRLILISDANAPNRLQSYQQDNFEILKQYLIENVIQLNSYNVNKIMICCLVAHACLKTFPSELSPSIINIVSLLDQEITQDNQKTILLSTPMFYELSLLENKNIIYLDSTELQQINFYIHQMKISGAKSIHELFISFIKTLLKKYNANSISLACSDLHLIHRFIMDEKIPIKFNIIDAVELAANYIIGDLHS